MEAIWEGTSNEQLLRHYKDAHSLYKPRINTGQHMYRGAENGEYGRI